VPPKSCDFCWPQVSDMRGIRQDERWD
jgi:hypothetical protein